MAAFRRGSTRARGEAAEDLAARELERAGLRILARNVRAAGAEIDLVAEGHDGAARLIVFCEVRSRARSDLGAPVETVGPTKQRRIMRAARSFLAREGLGEQVAVRFDVIGVVVGDPPALEWIRGAFEEA